MSSPSNSASLSGAGFSRADWAPWSLFLFWSSKSSSYIQASLHRFDSLADNIRPLSLPPARAFWNINARSIPPSAGAPKLLWNYIFDSSVSWECLWQCPSFSPWRLLTPVDPPYPYPKVYCYESNVKLSRSLIFCASICYTRFSYDGILTIWMSSSFNVFCREYKSFDWCSMLSIEADGPFLVLFWASFLLLLMVSNFDSLLNLFMRSSTLMPPLFWW